MQSTVLLRTFPCLPQNYTQSRNTPSHPLGIIIVNNTFSNAQKIFRMRKKAGDTMYEVRGRQSTCPRARAGRRRNLFLTSCFTRVKSYTYTPPRLCLAKRKKSRWLFLFTRKSPLFRAAAIIYAHVGVYVYIGICVLSTRAHVITHRATTTVISDGVLALITFVDTVVV